MENVYPFPLILENDDFVSSFRKESDAYISRITGKIGLLSHDQFMPFFLKAHAIENDIIKAYNEKLRCHNSVAEMFILKAMESLPEEVCFPRFDLSSAIKNNNVFYEPDEPAMGKITFYKARESKVDIPSMDMSFIPFEKRALVSDERFSSVGVPCLYLANSTAVCFKEMVKNSNNCHFYGQMFDYCYSCFDISSLRNHRILDLTYNLSAIDDPFDNDLKGIDWLQLIKYFYIRIIVIATSFVPREEDETLKRNFKPEYVIPQLIMDALFDKRKDVIGVAYMSLQIPTDNSNLRAVNLAFPNFKDHPGVCIKVRNSAGYSFSSVQSDRLASNAKASPLVNQNNEHPSPIYHDHYPLKSLIHLQNYEYFNGERDQILHFIKKLPNLYMNPTYIYTYEDFMEEDFIFLDDYLVGKVDSDIELRLN